MRDIEVNFFLLQDFLNADGTVRMPHDFDNFTALPIPDKVEDYDRYLMRCTELLHARNARIHQWCRDNLTNAEG